MGLPSLEELDLRVGDAERNRSSSSSSSSSSAASSGGARVLRGEKHERQESKQASVPHDDKNSQPLPPLVRVPQQRRVPRRYRSLFPGLLPTPENSIETFEDVDL